MKPIKPRRGAILVFLGRLVREITHIAPDVVWVPGWYSRSPLELIAIFATIRAMGRRIVYDPIDPIFEYEEALHATDNGSFSSRRRLAVLKAIYMMAHRLFVVTEGFRGLMVEAGVSHEKLRVAYWGTDASRFPSSVDPAIAKRRFDVDGRFVVGWIGSFTRFKGLESILLPAAKILEKEGVPVLFLLAGTPEIEEIVLRHRKEGGDSVRYLGGIPYEDAPLLTRAFDLYIVPTDPRHRFTQAICPVKVFDALVSGIPVVATRTAAMEHISGNFPSIVFSGFTPEEFARHISTIWNTPERFREAACRDTPKAMAYTHQAISELMAREIALLPLK